MEDSLELLFFDTFSHESSEEINLDLVQFPKPVYIGEVRIIPLGARVQADFPGGVRLGATNPSQFKIEFFVNDLSKPGASTFENLGAIDYNQNGNIHFEYNHSRPPIPTDGLVLRGWYTTITLAVYGVLTKTVPPEPAQPDMVTSVDWLQQHSQMEDGTRDYMVEGGHHYTSYPQDEVGDAYTSQDYRPQQSYSWHQGCHQESYDTPKEAYEGESWELRQEDKHWERSKDRHQDQNFRYERRHEERSPDYHERGTPEYDGRQSGDYYKSRRWVSNEWSGSRKRPHTPPPPPTVTVHETSPQQGQFESMSPGDVESISEGDIPETEGMEESGKASPTTPPAQSTSPQQKHTGEPFEPILSDDEIVDDQDMDYDFGEFTEDPLQSFNPYNNEIPSLKSFYDPAIPVYEWETKELLEKTDEDGEALKNLINSITNLHDSKGVWVETVEQVIVCIEKSLTKVATSERKEILDKLITWVAFGLNFKEAFEQPQPGLKLRHIKAGIRLVESLSQCGEEITLRMIEEADAQNKLLNLYHEEYMALIIKLMILRAIDATIRYEATVEKFIEIKTDNKSGYQRLIDMVQGNQHARVKYALCALVQKLHFYELLKSLKDNIQNLDNDIKKMKRRGVDRSDKFDREFLSMALEEVLKVFIEARTLLSHPKRFLPVAAQFEINTDDFPDPYKAIYTYFRFTNIIKSFVTLFSHPGTSLYLPIIAPVNGLISEILDTDDGMKFLASSPEINSLIGLLLGGSAKLDENEMGVPGLNPTLGLHLAYRLQALLYLDSIKSLRDVDSDKPEIIDSIQGLFNLTLSNIGNIGKSSVVHVLSQGSNLDVLLDLLKTKSNKKRSPSRGYICDLIVLTIKLTAHVPFLQRYSETLVELSKESFTEISEIQSWLSPIENCTTYEATPVCDIIKNNIDACTSLPPELITSVRLLKFLGVPKHEIDLSNQNFTSNYRELKHKFIILQLYSNDGLTHLSNILQKLCKHYDQPYLHSSRFIARQGLLLLALILPAVQLIRRMITYVINVRNTDFKDLTLVPILLQTFSLMQAIPLNAQAHTDAIRVCREIIETLLAYTQPVSSETSTETEALNKSLWTAMVSEVIKFASDVPLNFMTGLMVLSELLPLPLPIQTKSELSEEEISKFVNSRRLWSAHLHSLGSSIESMIMIMSASSCQPLLQLLRRVCIQLADIAAPTAILVVKTILESMSNLMNDKNMHLQLLRQINFLASLMSHGVIKVTFLNLLQNEKSLQHFQNLLKSFDQKAEQCVQIQEGLASICQSLVDTEIYLVQPPGLDSSITIETFMSCALPPKDILMMICLAMINYLKHDTGFTVSLTILRSLILLADHDYGFHHVKISLEKQVGCLYNLLVRVEKFMSQNWGENKEKKDEGWTPEKQECLAVVSSALELFRSLVNVEASEFNMRTLVLTFSELGKIIMWPSPDNSLLVIEEVLKKIVSEGQQDVEQLVETLSSFFVKLSDMQKNEAKSTSVAPETSTEPTIPPAESLLTQFSMRTVYTLTDNEEDRLSTAYWLSAPSSDEPEQDAEIVTVDLLEIAKTDLGGVSLSDAVAQLYDRKNESADTSDAEKKAKTNSSNHKKPFVTPMRGRGGIRGGGARGSDTFRSRPPNTSRPPSLHVDDFVALETCGTTGYTKSIQQQQDKGVRGRGRGRTFGMERGGKFFPGHLYHREGDSIWDRSQLYGSELLDGRFGRSQRSANVPMAWGSKEPRTQRGASSRHMRFFQT